MRGRWKKPKEKKKENYRKDEKRTEKGGASKNANGTGIRVIGQE